MRKLLPSILISSLVAATMAGCIVVDGTTIVDPQTATATGRQPIIQSFDYSPKTGVGKNDAIVFTLVATDPAGQVLSYTWSSTKGTLSATTGQTVSWRPTRADGSFEPGLSQVTVVVSNGAHVSTATVNIQINDQGEAVVHDVVKPTPAPEAGAAPSASPAPTSAPTAAPSAEPTAAPTAAPTEAPFSPGRIFFEDGFEGGLDKWTVGSAYQGANWNSLGWKTTLTGAHEGRVAAVLNDGDDEVKPSTEQYEIWISSKAPVDLTEAKLPRVKLYVKNEATPVEAVTYQVVLSKEANVNYSAGDLFKSSTFSGGKDWTAKDVDLSLAKGKVGYIGVVVTVMKNGTTFTGPMVDHVVVYDAGL